MRNDEMPTQNTSRLNDLKVSMGSALRVDFGVLLAFVALFIIASLVSPKFLTFNNIMSVLRTISTTAIVAFAMTYVIITGGIDLSVGSFMTLAGCLTTVLIMDYHISTIPAVAMAMCVGVVFGSFNGLVITKLRMPPFIVTLASMNILRGLSYLLTGGRPVIMTDKLFPRIGGGFWGPVPMPVVYTIVIFIVLWILLNRTRFGRHIYAVGGNITAARYSGIMTDRTIFVAYVLTGITASFSGIILCSRLNSGQPTIGQGAELDVIAAVIVGGVSIVGGSGTLVGTLTGCMIIGVISNLLNLVGMNSFVQLAIKGLIIILSVYIDTVRKGVGQGKGKS